MANRLCRRQTPFASPVITGWSVTKIGGLFHLLLTLWVGSLALAFAGIPSALVYTFSATSFAELHQLASLEALSRIIIRKRTVGVRTT